ncbi:PP2C family protein-serine/threonine phosphatase [Corynebacterium pygosceleis]|uniref:Protein phosphatase 2C domain-containing protein n=1 Tax=Corynebacterium pygosceleis TaxID=2800406 RepID=A0A9Q4C8T4_9CORY|nr:protein phosphatase 2C domain-containing protein [Corynebacterium pygosceleis]MCK7637236.1 protein phosphatase 2C domain-containing protein [Corynebacterium pygosceleis]MCK7676173.1 protein phosphatase 2C domain-containing protein [Corynebacterium pygosceleis]MCX7445139.1 protein phosphatase 2C domain-containing protein [Corynebacterium pygosceleis]MCX7468436.1 protein phosphatase 2C domain-containing protein [Corynebacterium pygosceleis]
MTWRLNYATASDRGLVRGNNEDSAYAGPHLLALADGMGGHAAGEIASQLMIDHLRPLDADPGDNDILALLGSLADDGNRSIATEVRRNPDTDGMGTTLTALLFAGRRIALCHVGDSRGYRLRDGNLEQITTDDTFVQSLVEEGKLDPEDISTHPQRSLILKAYTGRPVEPHLRFIDVRPGDRFLLCSDGLSDPVTHSTIEETLHTGTPTEAARRLVDLALRSGGPDNVTVVVADIVDTEKLSSPEEEKALPVTPVVAGALNTVDPETPRPDTAAGRAALMSARQPQEISSSGRVSPQSVGASAGAVDGPTDGGGTTRRLRWIIPVLVLVAALAGGGWWGWGQLNSTYYVSTVSGDTGRGGDIVIERGVNLSVLGRPLHSTYQTVCLDDDGKVTVVGGTTTDGCGAFNLDDLPESRRDSVGSLPPGSYDEVLQQLRRLAEDALPVCVTRESGRDTDAEDTPGEDAAGTGEGDGDSTESASTSTTAPRHVPGDLSTPGVNCREVNS